MQLVSESEKPALGDVPPLGYLARFSGSLRVICIVHNACAQPLQERLVRAGAVILCGQPVQVRHPVGCNFHTHTAARSCLRKKKTKGLSGTRVGSLDSS